MKVYSTIFLLLFVGFTNTLKAQYVEESDSEAVEILKNVSEDFQNNGAHDITFQMDFEYPGEATQVQEGSLLQSGENFVLDMTEQMIVSDNETVWLYLKERNELQINDADFGDDGEYLSPSMVYKLYDSGDFIFALSNQQYEDGQAITQIEAKPKDQDSEYSKIRLTVYDKSNSIKRVKVFFKDASRMTMLIKDHKRNLSFTNSRFKFDSSKYDGIIVEDLRF